MRYLQGIISYVTLKYNMPVVSRHILKLSLTKKVGKAEPGLSYFLRKSEHLTLMDLIDHMRLQNDYEAYLKALILRHEKNYKGSLEMVANDRNKALVPFKTKLYYNLKRFDEIEKIASAGYDVLGKLSADQQEILVRNLLKNNKYQLIEKMIDVTEKNKTDLEELYHQEKDDLFYQYSWSNYRENILEGVDTDSPLEAIKAAIDQTDENMHDLGYVLVINNYFLADRHLGELNDLFVDYVNRNDKLLKYIDPIALDTLDFDLNYKDKKSERLQNLLNYYHFGKGTKMLMQNIFKLLPDVTLNAQHIMSLRRLILDGHLNFEDARIKKLFKTDKRLESVFHSATLFLDEGTRTVTDEFVYNNFNTREKRRIYNAVINQLQRVNKRYNLPIYIFSYLEKSAENKQNHSYILARFYATEGDTEKLNEILNKNNAEKQLKIHINLSMYLFNLKMYKASLSHAEAAYKIKSINADVLRALIRVNHVMGNIDERYNKLIEMRKHFPSRVYPGEFLMAEQEYQLSHSDWEAEALPEDLKYQDDGKSILFVLNKAMPAVNGYTIRTNEIVSRVQKYGYRPVATSRLGWSPEHENYEKPGLDDGDYRTYYIDRSDKYLTNRTPLRKYFNVYRDELLKIVLKEKPAVIHAASNFQNAMPALQLGNQLNIKTIYEVRGMWHHTQTSKVPEFLNSDRFNMQEHYEVLCCQLADEVIVISESLREYLILKGIPAEKITVLPNGVDSKKLSPLEKSENLIKRYQLDDSIVLGFIGSITNYEGIELIIDTIQSLNKKNHYNRRFKFLVVGDGQHRAALQRKVLDQNLSEDIIFTGKVPFETVKDYYSVIDIAPFPRLDKLVCQLVTPIKTYEAMAMGKRVIVSDVNALKEMVIDQVNGVYFKADNQQSFEEAVISVLNNEAIGESAREWVVENRDWKVLLKKLVKVYEKLDIKAS
ncbi:glycosyltransferase [Jeotgalicoccus nanhaiensis]|uniref:Glycosyltransferase n=1 Tax=Jeotgalicoccus nanhaiensis TaxID=568603 RepID=A0ABR9XW14_9STAP|nr:glycosyltransferase family 4 protein [Jeotgalicoccus nanhaiensis]MBF0752634.1 glycosyltransferase [Jeotgalicoccus nanhaiensis]TFU62808.1 glycosyltransferase [Jeotgalicoccus nanhaiensis]